MLQFAVRLHRMVTEQNVLYFYCTEKSQENQWGDFMKTEGNILTAFFLNLAFAVFECIGGILTGSVAVLSDAVHDLGDAVSIGTAAFLEIKSRKKADDTYTYGYARFSVLGGLITTVILLAGSVGVIAHAVVRLLHPTPIHYDGMILFAVVGVAVNLTAAYFTRNRDSVNQRAVNLHMLEDVLGWIVVLIGAVVIRFTELTVLDPVLSIVVAAYILMHAIRNLWAVLTPMLERIPEGITVQQVQTAVSAVEGVAEVHHIHLWSLDGIGGYATMHIVTEQPSTAVKERVRRALQALGVSHATLELEQPGEECSAQHCQQLQERETHCGHHHHHGHGHHH